MDEGTTLGFCGGRPEPRQRPAAHRHQRPGHRHRRLHRNAVGRHHRRRQRSPRTAAARSSLAGANTYTGATTVAMRAPARGAANAFSAASAHTVAAGATLDPGGFNQRVASLANSGTVSLVGHCAGHHARPSTAPTSATTACCGWAPSWAAGAGVSDRLVLDGPAPAPAARPACRSPTWAAWAR